MRRLADMDLASHSWTRRRDWREGVVRSRPYEEWFDNRAATVIALAVVASFVLGGKASVVRAVIIGAIWLLVICFSVYAWLRGRGGERFEFRFQQTPFVLGSEVCGTIIAPFRGSLDEFDSVFIGCQSGMTPGRRTSRPHFIWADSVALLPGMAARIGDKVHIPISFDTSAPHGSPRPTDAPVEHSNSIRIQWWLSLSGIVNGHAYRVSFEIPVFAAAEVGTVAATSVKRISEADSAQERIALHRAQVAAAEIAPHSGPWLRHQEWRSGVIHRVARARVSQQIRERVLWFAIPLDLFLFVILDNDAQKYLAFAVTVILVLIITNVPLPGAARSVPIEFRFDSVPFILGSKLRGTIAAPFGGQPENYTRVSLKCVDGMNIAWSHSHSFVLDRIVSTNGTTQIPVLFDLPDNAPITGPHSWWQIELTARFKLVDYESQFSVPVFAQNAAPHVEPTTHANASKSMSPDMRKDLSVFDE